MSWGKASRVVLGAAVSWGAAIASTCAVAHAVPAAPVIGSSSVTSVGPTIATIEAHIVPNGSDTSYSLEYGPTASYGSLIPISDSSAVAGGEEAIVSQSIAGLTPNTAYHYRILAANAEGAVASEDKVFSTFGIQSFEASAINPDGSLDLQAGSHPYEVTASLKLPLNHNAQGEPIPAGAPKDLDIELPSGMVGNPRAVPQCPESMLAGPPLGRSRCPADTQIGILQVDTATSEVTAPIYNLVPPAGMPAQFGVYALLASVTLDASVRTGGGYGLTLSLANLSQLVPFSGMSLTFWGVPADPSHNPYRGECLSITGTSTGECPSGAPPMPLITMPTTCDSPLSIGLRVDSWEEPGYFLNETYALGGSAGGPTSLSGCEMLAFSPSMTVTPDNAVADAPAGLTVNLTLASQGPNALASSSLQDAEVTLPEGMTINPAAADGLAGCSMAQINIEASVQPSCPAASRIGSVEIATPLLNEPLTGALYLAAPGENPFGGLFAAYVVAEGSGVVVKVPLELSANPVTGRLTIRMTNMPQLPFASITLSLNGGPRAMLANPVSCDTSTATAHLTPYSGQPSTVVQSDFQVAELCNGGFNPTFLAGSTALGAGSPTGFLLRVDRDDRQQPIESFSATLPAGLLANLDAVPRCPARLAASGDCDLSSQIGKVTVAAGAGSDPVYLSGSVFLTGPYRAAPFGLAIVVPVSVGPFKLGTIVVRAQVSLAASDLRMTIVSDPLPQTVSGIPLRLRMLNVAIDRADFLFNPTNCATQSVQGTIRSAGGVSVSRSSAFQIAGCAALPFSPALHASAQVGESDHGRSAGVNIEVRSGGRHQASIRAVRLTLRGPLRPRLNTIQQACPWATFHAGASGCPRGSRVGWATMVTPMLPSSLRGEVYLVARGGTAYPRLVTVLKGEGISVSLDGVVRVSNGGVLRTSFAALPDVPISVFTLELSRGPHSILGSVSGVCSRPPSIRYVLVGQNGLQHVGTTVADVNGCVQHGAARGAVKRRSHVARRASHAPKHPHHQPAISGSQETHRQVGQ